MHELGITRNIVAIVVEHAGNDRVCRVQVEIGRLSAIVPDAVRFCYDVCASGTPLEGSELEIVDAPGRWLCRACGTEFVRDSFVGACNCGSAHLDCVGGQELRILEMETV